MIDTLKIPRLALVIPCYNEEAVITITAERLLTVLKHLIEQRQIAENSFLCFVDDGSSDQTWHLLKELHTCHDKYIQALKFSRNFGHQPALLAGLLHVKDHCDCAISIDADLQQDETAIPTFLQKYREGCDIVFGVRTDREADNFFKKSTALFFYSFMKMLGVKILRNHADYRLLSHSVLNVLADYPETNLFLRGLFFDLGFKTGVVNFTTKQRLAGETKYSLKKMLAFALNGIISFSSFPLRLVGILGSIIFVCCLFLILYILIAALLGKTIPGWASTVLPIYFIGGIQLMCLGIVAEYLGRVYKEVKKRPRYIVQQKLD